MLNMTSEQANITSAWGLPEGSLKTTSLILEDTERYILTAVQNEYRP